MNYSEITEMSHPLDLCCDERMFVSPCCGVPLCIFCADSCDECGAVIDFTR